MKYRFGINLCKVCFYKIIVISSILCIPYFASQTQASEQINFQSKAEDLFDQGIKYYNEQKLHEAIEKFNLAINLDKNYDSAYYMRGIAYYDKGNISEATKNISKAIHINPDAWLYILNQPNRGSDDVDTAKKKYQNLWKLYQRKGDMGYLNKAKTNFLTLIPNTQGKEKKIVTNCYNDVVRLIKNLNTPRRSISTPTKSCTS
jgi:tetratricopeptide (TPR) repeat protein